MEKFILPEAWCCLATTQEEDRILTDYINENFHNDVDYFADYDPNVQGNCWFTNIKLSHGFYYMFDKPPIHCTEITFHQFKDYVLGEKPADNSDLAEIYLKLLQ
jgi:hypothetical protein